FNSVGIGAVSLTSATRIGVRNANYDVAEEVSGGSAPGWIANTRSYIAAHSAEMGEGFAPELTVWYSLPEPEAGAEVYSEGNYFDIGARVYNNYSQTIPDAVGTALVFNSERYDTGNIHSCTANSSRLTCKVAGKYMVVYNGRFLANPDGRRYFFIYLNRTTNIGLAQAGLDTSNFLTIPLVTIYDLNVNDYVEIYAYQNSGSSLKIQQSSEWSSEFTMQRIGVGGEVMDIAVDFPAGFYALIFGAFLMFINFFLKKGIIYLAIIPCMIGCLVEPAFRNAWFQSGCVLVMIWSVLAFYKSMQKGETG
ncbi:unnamed protein product, partial [marine sediment metagenome]